MSNTSGEIDYERDWPEVVVGETIFIYGRKIVHYEVDCIHYRVHHHDGKCEEAEYIGNITSWKKCDVPKLLVIHWLNNQK
jgi:hypothetical protein